MGTQKWISVLRKSSHDDLHSPVILTSRTLSFYIIFILLAKIALKRHKNILVNCLYGDSCSCAIETEYINP